MFQKIDHIGIAVSDLNKSVEEYQKKFNVTTKYIEELADISVRIAFMPVGEVMLELIEPLKPGEGRIAEFLKKHGEGLHHIAYRVDNLEAVLARMKKEGVKLIDEKPRPGGGDSWIAFLSPQETNNVLTELVQREREL